MIYINITDEQGGLLARTSLDTDDLSLNGTLRPEWVGETVLRELPSNKEALMALLKNKDGDTNGQG